MTDLTGYPLQDFGQQVFTTMGLDSIGSLNQVRLVGIAPSGPYTRDEHIEFDYLIPYENICLVGEITARQNPDSVRNKYRRFRQHYDILRQLAGRDEGFWRKLGVPTENLSGFRQINDFRGFFITTRLQRFDVELSPAPAIVRFYATDWHLLVAYSDSIGAYAADHFLHLFDIPVVEPNAALIVRKDPHGLLRIPDRKVASGNVGLADVYTFEVSPYDLFPMAKVYRRDELARVSLASQDDYQRPLLPDKLDSIRAKLLANQDFMFPSSILAVLSSDCRYNCSEATLMIPKKHGALSIIDGQHRLFSYAQDCVRQRVGDHSRIMVTAILFRDTEEEAIREYSARGFVEINTNQTRVPRTHLDAIAYPILGDSSPRAIAAQVILKANERRQSKLYGLFDTVQTGLGIIQATTVVAALQSITNIRRIQRLRGAQRGSPLKTRLGYERLFGADVVALSEPDSLIERGEVCLTQYFNRVGTVFAHDWPQRGESSYSTLAFAKMIAGFVKLLWHFIQDGLDWRAVQTELESIKRNVMHVRCMQEYDAVLFDPGHEHIPDAQPSATDDYRFLNSNRQLPTSIQEVIAQRRRA